MDSQTPKPVRAYTIPEVKLARIRECQVDNPILDTAERAAAFWRENVPNAVWFDPDKECSVVLLLNTRRCIIGFTLIASGTLDTCFIHAREVFKAAIVAGASAVVLMHNHPSGNPSPSGGDIKVTGDMVRAGELIGIPVLDHVIVGDKTEQHCGYASLREMGLIH